MVLVAVPIKVHLENFQKKTSSIRRGGYEISFLSARNILSAGVGTFPRRGVAVVSKGQSLNHSG
jgi:hypothetical protein